MLHRPSFVQRIWLHKLIGKYLGLRVMNEERILTNQLDLERRAPTTLNKARQESKEQILKDVQEGLTDLIRALESRELNVFDPVFKTKLMELDASSRQFLGLLQEIYTPGRSRSEFIEDIDNFKIRYRFTQQIDLLIEQNLDDHKFGVNELARAMGMSRSQIHRKLTALTEQSANCYIRNYRLHRAAKLLRESSLNVSDIAYQVGFGSQTYFSKCFREIFMMSPTSYRNTFEKGKRDICP